MSTKQQILKGRSDDVLLNVGEKNVDGYIGINWLMSNPNGRFGKFFMTI